MRADPSLLKPGSPPPQVDFGENALVLVLTGPGSKGAWVARFKRSDRYSDRTVLWYDEAPQDSSGFGRFWVLQVVPKPDREPVLIQKIQ